MTDRDVATEALYSLVERARTLAKEYYQLTGRPLGVTGEVGECEASRILGLRLAPAREAGYDAIDQDGIRYQVKSRCVVDARKSQRIGSIKLSQPWDAVLLVLLDAEFHPTAIWRAERAAIAAALLAPGSKARNERGALGISKFKQVAVPVWERTAVTA